MMSTKTVWILLLVVALGVAGAAYDRFLDTPGGTARPAVNPTAPLFTVADLNGQVFDLEKQRGKTVIINFWATWCAPCVAEFPPMLEFAATHDAILLALSSDERDDDIQLFLERLPKVSRDHLKSGNVIIARDPDRTITRSYGTTMYPETYIIAPDGTIARKIAGVVEWDDPLLSRYISSLTNHGEEDDAQDKNP